MTNAFASLAAYARRHVPTRESLEANRWLRPFAHRVLRPELWRLTRRSVPRAIALGLFVGVTIPVAHTFIAPLLAVGVRANVPVAAVSTWVSNPFTWPLMWWAAYRIGKFMLHLDAAVGLNPVAGVADHPLVQQAAQGHHHHHLHALAHAGIATATGLFVEATLLATIGYLAAGLVWRGIIARKRTRRLDAARQRAGSLAG